MAALTNGLGQLREPSSKSGTPRACHRSGNIIAPVGLEVCDGAHWLDVMKKVRIAPKHPNQCFGHQDWFLLKAG